MSATSIESDDFPITLGVEEEVFLVDPESRDLLADPDPAIMAACEEGRGPHKVVTELLRSQIETNTRVCASVAELREALVATRRLVIEAAGRHGAAIYAGSTHPFAAWDEQMTTPKERYRRFAITFQQSILRFLAGGMHIHAGFGDADSRIRVMTAMRRWLPLLHALSTSSPFSGGRETGFKSHRLNLFGALQRTSLPPPLASRADFDAHVAEYQRLEFVRDASELWWDIRPSHAYPTVELRICDICPLIDEAMAIVALYASLIRWLLRRDAAGDLPGEPPTEIVAENRWLAQRYGVLAFLGDLERGGRTDIEDLAARALEAVADDARALGCEKEIGLVPAIIRQGSSADRQVDHYRLRLLEGDGREEAMRAVVDLVIAETRRGTGV